MALRQETFQRLFIVGAMQQAQIGGAVAPLLVDLEEGCGHGFLKDG